MTGPAEYRALRNGSLLPNRGAVPGTASVLAVPTRAQAQPAFTHLLQIRNTHVDPPAVDAQAEPVYTHWLLGSLV